jgi:hypothetical protein
MTKLVGGLAVDKAPPSFHATRSLTVILRTIRAMLLTAWIVAERNRALNACGFDKMNTTINNGFKSGVRRTDPIK